MRNKIKRKKTIADKKMSFEAAVKATANVASGYKRGLQALEKDHSQKIKADTKKIEGSLFIDECLKKIDNGNRWDYAIGYKGEVYFVEVHSANTSEVSTVLKKLAWLKVWLNNGGTAINSIKAKDCYHWIQSGKFNILKQSRQYRLAEQEGLMPKPFLDLN